MFAICFNFCSIIILLIVLASLYSKKGIPILQNRIFTILVSLVLISTLCDFTISVFQYLKYTNLTPFHFSLTMSTNYLYFVARNLSPFVYILYIAAVLNITVTSRIQHFIVYTPVIVNFILIALTPFYDFVFFLDENGIYHRGFLLSLLYLTGICYLLYAIYLVARYRKALSVSMRLALYSFILLALLTVIIQGLYPHFAVEAFGSAICMLLLYLTLQSPEETLDGATGYLNKSAFSTMLTVKFRQAKNFDIILISIEDFSFLEKSLGHSNLNKLLSTTLTYFRHLTKQATFYRVSVDQLCIIMKEKASHTLAELLTLKLKIRAEEPWQVEGLSVVMPAQISLISFPTHADTPTKALDLIETISFHLARGESVTLGSLELSATQRKHALDGIVKAALAENLLEVYYQPIYSPQKSCFVCAEALLRLRHPELGFVSPDEFIPIAEQNGTIVQIGRFVLEEVCRMLKENQLELKGIECIEVNLSIVECLQDDLVEKVLSTLKKYGIESKQVNFEITETAENVLPDTVSRNLEMFSKANISLSLDDYGTGYSNLIRVLSMPLEIIKIDKSVVQSALSLNSDNALIVLTNTVQMLHQLNKQVVAEGAETREQAEQLISMDCDFIQGYYYAKPMSKLDFINILKTDETTNTKLKRM